MNAEATMPQRSFGKTMRADVWWTQPLLVFLGLSMFIVPKFRDEDESRNAVRNLTLIKHAARCLQTGTAWPWGPMTRVVGMSREAANTASCGPRASAPLSEEREIHYW